MKNVFRAGIAAIALSLSSISHAAFVVGTQWSDNIIPFKFDNTSGLSLNATDRNTFITGVEYYETISNIRFFNIDDPLDEPSINRSLYTNRSKYVLVKKSTVNHSHAIGAVVLWVTPDPYAALTENISLNDVLHELFHVAGFGHEHSRHDRDNYVELDPLNTDTDPLSYGILDFAGWNEYTYGAYDYNSISHYPKNIYNNQYSNIEILKLAKDKISSHMSFMIMVKDGSPSNSFDNLVVNNQLTGPTGALQAATFASISTFSTGPLSSAWYFEYTGNSNKFKIKHRWSNQYLRNYSGTLGFSTSSSSTYTDWSLSSNSDGTSFKIFNPTTNQYIYNDSSNNIQLGSSASASNWLLRIPTNEGKYQDELSLMDLVGLNWLYGNSFRIKEVDSTPQTTSDNPTVHIQDGPLKLLPADYVGSWSNNALTEWFSAQWYLDRVGSRFQTANTEFVRIRNRWTDKYLHLEFGSLDLASENDRNEEGVSTRFWWTAHWLLEIKPDHFLIQNRWTGQYLKNDNGNLTVSNTPSKWLVEAVIN